MSNIEFYLIVFWPYAAGLALGLTLRLILRRRDGGRGGRLDGVARAIMVTGATVALIGVIVPPVLQIIDMQTQLDIGPDWLRGAYNSPMYYAIPLIAGALTVALILCAPLPNSTGAGADLAPRTMRSFVTNGALIAIGLLSAAAVAIAIAAGRISTVDESGDYRVYLIDPGAFSGSTGIYGWYFSIPALITLAVLLALTLVTLWRIARPSLGGDPSFDIAMRKSRSGVVTSSVAAALTLHLGYVGVSLAATAGLKMGARVGTGDDWVRAWPTFAALEPALRTTALLLQVIGIAIWAYIFWRAVLGDRKLRG